MMKTKLFPLILLMGIMIDTSGQIHLENIVHVWGGLFCDQSPLIVDHSGNIYLAGMYLDTTKISSDGSPGWTKVISGSGHEYITDIEVDQKGFIYLIGDFGYTMRIDDVLIEAFSGSDSYLCKLDPDGNLVEPPKRPGKSEFLYFLKNI